MNKIILFASFGIVCYYLNILICYPEEMSQLSITPETITDPITQVIYVIEGFKQMIRLGNDEYVNHIQAYLENLDPTLKAQVDTLINGKVAVEESTSAEFRSQNFVES